MSWFNDPSLTYKFSQVMENLKHLIANFNGRGIKIFILVITLFLMVLYIILLVIVGTNWEISFWFLFCLGLALISMLLLSTFYFNLKEKTFKLFTVYPKQFYNNFLSWFFWRCLGRSKEKKPSKLLSKPRKSRHLSSWKK